MAANPLDALVRHVATTVYEDLPPAVVAAAKTFILDTFTCGIAGSSGPGTDRILAAAQSWGDGDAATAWGHGKRLPAPSAALLNAYQVHCLEFDCVHEGSVLHPMTAMLPAAIAEAQRQSRAGRRISGRDLIAAVAVGVDVVCNIGLSAKGAMRFFRTGSIGGFGATAVAAKLRGFSAEYIAAALGIMYGQTSGTMQTHVEGSPLLGVQVGFNARGALCAVDLAAAEIDGPRNIITGPWGYLPLFEGEHTIDATWASWGKTWRLLEMGHKPFPSGRPTHYVIEALQELQAELRFTASDVAGVHVRLPPLSYAVVGRPDIPAPNPTYAKLCVPFICATVLRRGGLATSDFAPEALIDPETHRIAARVTVEEDKAGDATAFGPQTVTVTLNDGRSGRREIAFAIGDPRHPLPRAKQLEKFWWAWESAAVPPPRAAGERFLAQIDALETLPDVTVLVDTMTV